MRRSPGGGGPMLHAPEAAGFPLGFPCHPALGLAPVTRVGLLLHGVSPGLGAVSARNRFPGSEGAWTLLGVGAVRDRQRRLPSVASSWSDLHVPGPRDLPKAVRALPLQGSSPCRGAPTSRSGPSSRGLRALVRVFPPPPGACDLSIAGVPVLGPTSGAPSHPGRRLATSPCWSAAITSRCLAQRSFHRLAAVGEDPRTYCCPAESCPQQGHAVRDCRPSWGFLPLATSAILPGRYRGLTPCSRNAESCLSKTRLP